MCVCGMCVFVCVCVAVCAVCGAVVVYSEGQGVSSHRLLSMVKVLRRAVRKFWDILKLKIS